MASQVIGLQPANKVELFRQTRDDALERGDAGVYRAMCVELDRLGYIDAPTPTTSVLAPVETAAVAAPERAVPRAKRPRTS